MEQPRMHEIVRPVREIVSHIGQWVLDKVLPTEVFDHFVTGVQQEGAERAPTYTQFPLSYDSEGCYFDREDL